MIDKEIEQNIQLAIRAAYLGGLEILKVYNTDFNVEHKADNSPLTEADKNANEVIVKELKTTSIPILSEEGKEIHYNERKEWTNLWIVDPLDGTKEFIKKNGEFTVNIALIENNRTLGGVIYLPVYDKMYFGIKGKGAYRIESYASQSALNIASLIETATALPEQMDRNYTVVGSRSHMTSETQEYVDTLKEKYGNIEIVSAGSSLKLCMVAEGAADQYPRFAPTMEWDTAAGQAIVEASGGQVIDWETKEAMLYNRENLLNNWFLVRR